ncbi:MAG: MarR family winged helix-turn-helix transcriptional regulator [Burkholderiales bacterium]
MAAKPRKRARLEVRQGILPELLGYRLRLAQQALFRDFAASVDELSPGQAGILLLIEVNPGIAQGRLAEAVRLDRSTMVGVVDALEERGVIARRRGSDRRTNRLSLTRAGRALVRRLRGRIEEHEARFAARLSEAERTQLLHLLGKLAP